jgi:hypothetical protein
MVTCLHILLSQSASIFGKAGSLKNAVVMGE